MEIWVEGKLGAFPQLSAEEKFKQAQKKLHKFWNTPLRQFWKNVYVHYRNELCNRASTKDDED